MNRPNSAVEVTEACVPNIGKRGRTRRLRNGIIELAAGVALAGWMVARGGTSWWLWAAVFALYLLGMLGVFQAKEKT